MDNKSIDFYIRFPEKLAFLKDPGNEVLYEVDIALPLSKKIEIIREIKEELELPTDHIFRSFHGSTYGETIDIEYECACCEINTLHQMELASQNEYTYGITRNPLCRNFQDTMELPYACDKFIITNPRTLFNFLCEDYTFDFTIENINLEVGEPDYDYFDFADTIYARHDKAEILQCYQCLVYHDRNLKDLKGVELTRINGVTLPFSKAVKEAVKYINTYIKVNFADYCLLTFGIQVVYTPSISLRKSAAQPGILGEVSRAIAADMSNEDLL